MKNLVAALILVAAFSSKVYAFSLHPLQVVTVCLKSGTPALFIPPTTRQFPIYAGPIYPSSPIAIGAVDIPVVTATVLGLPVAVSFHSQTGPNALWLLSFLAAPVAPGTTVPVIINGKDLCGNVLATQVLYVNFQ